MPDLVTSISIAVISIVAAGALGILISAYFRSSKDPSVAVRSSNILRDHVSRIQGLDIKYGGQPIASLTISRLLFWNRGREPIQDRDIVEEIKIVPLTDVNILDTRILQSNNPTNRISVSTIDEDGTVKIIFRHLDQEDGVVLQVIHTGKSSSDIGISGGIVGVKQIRRRRVEVLEGEQRVTSILGFPVNFSRPRWTRVFVPPFAFAVATGGSVGSMFIWASTQDSLRADNSRGFVAGVVIIVGLLAWAGIYSILQWQKRVPRGLESYEEDLLKELPQTGE